MKNYEKYLDMVLRTASNYMGIRGITNEPCNCREITCECCKFNNEECDKKFYEWLNEEYEEPSVDWTKVAVDTPILVRQNKKETWTRRYFAAYEDGEVYAFSEGTTSWSDAGKGFMTNWNYAKLANESDK